MSMHLYVYLFYGIKIDSKDIDEDLIDKLYEKYDTHYGEDNDCYYIGQNLTEYSQYNNNMEYQELPDNPDISETTRKLIEQFPSIKPKFCTLAIWI